MEEKNYTGLIPGHETGVIIESAASTDFKNTEEAHEFYAIAKERLLQVNNWHNIAKGISAVFELVDENGNEVNRSARKGDYFKIDIPGPGSKAGEGYDWVQIEEFNEVSQPEVDSIGLRVRPSSNPLNKDESVAHFYSEESTSTFIVTRENNKVSANIYDRNTKPNKDTESITDKIRDVAVGLGALLGMSKKQWQGLADGLVKKE